ncbi:MAG TPA: hypothetical protein VJS20_01155 [Gemmatimonadales bacterium]|nr:hypothetical protein [Gemmatimonadales bacterium]
MKRLLRWIGISAAIVGAGCQTDHALGPVVPTDHGPGALELRIAGPDSGLGALLLGVAGGPVDSITATGIEATALAVGADDYRVALRGSALTQVAVRLWVPDLRQRAVYSATVVQAVEETDYRLRPTADYRISIAPVPARGR